LERKNIKPKKIKKEKAKEIETKKNMKIM